MNIVKKLHFKDFRKTKTGYLNIKHSSTEDLLDDVNQWLGRTGVTLINVETIYEYGMTGEAVASGFTGVRVWFLYNAKPSPAQEASGK